MNESRNQSKKGSAAPEAAQINIARMLVKYEPQTKTLRAVPQNYCICALRTFTQIEGATDAALGDLDKLGYMLAARINRNLKQEAVQS